jgi:hypothetical protein
MTKPGANPFSSPGHTRGVLVAIHADKTIAIAENIFPEGDLLIPLSAELEKSTAKAGPNSQWAEQVLKLSVF